MVVTMPLLEGLNGVQQDVEALGELHRDCRGLRRISVYFGKLMSISDNPDVALFRAAQLFGP